MVPDRYIRKQTLTNGERYFTPELKEYEDKVLGATDKLYQMEYDVFVESAILLPEIRLGFS